MPSYLPDAGGRIASVALIEVSGKRPQPADYAQDFGKGPLPFDWMIFTPRAERSDPCAGLRAHRRAQPEEPAKGPGDRAP